MWQNRIVGEGTEAPDQLLANPNNWRIHPKHQQEALQGALREIGWIQRVIVNKRTGHVVDGHARVAIAISEGEQEVPVLYVDLSEEEEKLALATLDPIAAMAATDQEMLDGILRELKVEDEGLAKMVDELRSEPIAKGQTDEDAVPEVTEEPKSKRGEVYELGRHRLMCGDSTSEEDVGRLMDGQKADMCFTDPPYGVDYEGGHFHSGDVNIKRERESLAADDSPAIYAKVLPVAVQYVDGPCYTWFADIKGAAVLAAVEAVGQLHAMIIWNKTNATYAAMNAQYKNRHEPCLYWKPKGSTLRWAGPTTECTVWDIKRDPKNEYHPTQKPTALAERAIGNHAAESVLDLFLGSGSTLIACEKLNRTCYGMEIDEHYCDVIRKRWAEFVHGEGADWEKLTCETNEKD